MKEISNFLQTLRHRLHYIITPEEACHVVLVMGNASCDIDSMASPILFAFMKNMENGVIVSKDDKTLEYVVKQKNEIFVPVINCPKNEFMWRLDISEICLIMGLNTEDFFFYEDVFNTEKQSLVFKLLEGKNTFIIFRCK